MNHGGMGMEMDRCSMNVSIFNLIRIALGRPLLIFVFQMLFTWDTRNLCIIFRWWHIKSNAGLVLSLLAVVALTAGYEAIRSFSRKYETWVDKRQEEAPSKLFLDTHLHDLLSMSIILLSRFLFSNLWN